MEENSREFNYFPRKSFPNMMSLIDQTLRNPLFSSIIALYIIGLLFFPAHFLGIIFSPVINSTFILLLLLLRLGSKQRQKELNSAETVSPQLNSAANISTRPLTEHIHECLDDDRNWVSCKSNEGSENEPGSGRGPEFKFYEDSFVEWDVRAPLEVIYEAYEGEEEGNDDVSEENRQTQMAIIEKYASLSMYFPETDSDTSSSGADFPAIGELESPERAGFRWDEEDGEGLIEIALDGKRKSEAEEENLIEIDLSPAS